MNKHKLTILGLSLMALVSSCRKMDVQPAAAPETPITATAAAPAAANQWQTIASWNSTSADKYSIHNGKIEDGRINAAVIEKGLVLVYKNNGNGVQSLPYQDKSTNQYWYYQASEGALTINCDAYNKGGDLGSAPTFRYFVLTEQQIKDLEAQGKSKFELMSLSFEAANALLNK